MRLALALYLPVQLVLLAGAITGQQQVRAVTPVLIMVIGATTFTVAVARRRPQPRWAWWLVAAASWSLLVQAFSVVAVYGGVGAEPITIGALAPLMIAVVPFPLLAAGLFGLSRVTGRRGPVDSLDATMIVLAAFLLLWAFILDNSFVISPQFAAVAILLPIGALVAFAMVVKVVLGGGLRDPATALLAVIVTTLLGIALNNLTRGVGLSSLRTSTTTNILWSIYGLILGVIGLLPSFTRPRQRAELATSDMSTTRLVVFGIVVLVPLVAWLDSIVGPPTAGYAVVVTLVVSAVFLVCLVTRLALLARLAQRRSNELASAVAEQVALQEQLRYQATHDPLTGLANRQLLTEQLTHAREAQPPASTALLMLDIDGFKNVNDLYGHPVGDELLTHVARRLVATAPPTATLARLGGDEFVILLKDTDRESAERTADRVVSALREPYDVDSRHLNVTASVGVVVVKDGQPLSAAEMLRNADVALYQAKQAGRNRAVIRDLSKNG